LQPYSAYKESGVRWLGQIPQHWEIQRLKYLCSVNDEQLSEDTDPEYEILYVDIGSVDASEGIQRKDSMRFGDAPSRARRKVRQGDVIVSTVRTYLRAIAPITHPEPNLVVSTGFAVIRPRSKLDTEYASYALRAPYFVEAVVANSVGVGYPAINARDLVSLPIVFPSKDEQKKIAAFLNRKTEHIDILIAKKMQQIRLLHEKRDVLISRAVTRGLSTEVAMRDSNVEWLGKIPANWTTVRSKFALVEIDERSKTGDEELLTVSHITGVTPRSEKNVNMFMAETLEGYKKCKAGDLIINTMWAWMGALGTAFQNGVVSPSYNVYRFRSSHSNPRFYDRLFRTRRFAEEMKRHSKGVWESRLRLYPQEFFQIRIPCPPDNEQAAINGYLDHELSRLDHLVMKVRESIEKLKEYRTALIAAVATGKIDLRNEVS
jgi:type I restriction enzyme, S subunit